MEELTKVVKEAHVFMQDWPFALPSWPDLHRYISSLLPCRRVDLVVVVWEL